MKFDNETPIAVFWFRRDIRMYDNTGLHAALTSGLKVLPVFIFDKNILNTLQADDERVSFIYQALESINQLILPFKTGIHMFHGNPSEIFSRILSQYNVKFVFANHDYEPYSINRDNEVKALLEKRQVKFVTFKDQVIFEKNEIVKLSGEPYTVFTPYSHKWLDELSRNTEVLQLRNSENYFHNFLPTEQTTMQILSAFGFNEKKNIYKPFEINKLNIENYHKTRNIPSLDSTSKISVHLRFGTVSIRQLVSLAFKINSVWLNELIWREFFMQILWRFPHVTEQPFKPKYKYISWLNNESEFKAWCNGTTGYPIVDAGMRQLNATGFMHNRVRMVTASFLVKHLLINWQWGEAYFAEKLLDFELSSNNGNWQWAAGTGCDAAPYFRIFNPYTQAQRFDPHSVYIKKWVPEYETSLYCKPIVEHNFARNRCIQLYKAGLSSGI